VVGVVIPMGAVWFGLGDWLGTVGYILAAVLIVAAVALKVLGATVRAVSG
jgi:hypothetical protein